MADALTMPKLGLTMTEGTIRRWLVADGDRLEAGDPALIIETDKVETEVEARSSGTIAIVASVGETYSCGETIAWLGTGAEGLAGETEPPAPVEPSASLLPRVPALPSALGQPPNLDPAVAPVGGASVAVADRRTAVRGDNRRVLASPRARATARTHGLMLDEIAGTGPLHRIVHDDVVAFVADLDRRRIAVAQESAEAKADAEASTGGATLTPVEEDDAIDATEAAAGVGVSTGLSPGAGRSAQAPTTAILVAASSSTPSPTSVNRPAAGTTTPSAATQTSTTAAAPTTSTSATAGARVLAEAVGVDLARLPRRSGQRLGRADVLSWLRSRLEVADVADAGDVVGAGTQPTRGGAFTENTAPRNAAIAASASRPRPEPLQAPSEVIAFGGMRGTIAERMHQSLAEMAQLTVGIDADMRSVNDERDRRRGAGNLVPGYTAWVVSAAAQALAQHRIVNSQLIERGVALLPDIHIGVAVALESGLVVPVVEYADLRSVEEIHNVIADLAGRARNGRLQPSELEGATFSVTALGMYGVDMFTPVVNPPNTAILGVGRLRSETAWDRGLPRERTAMTLSLTWDHQAFDGAPAAEFARTIVRRLENAAELV